jgi:Fe-coproporphyrin III synthase
MCNIWQKKSVDEMTPAEVALFFERWPQFRWVHLTGGELFMRRDLDELVAAIQSSCRSLFLLNFPTTGWFGDRTVQLVERTLARGVGRLMVTISLDGPKALHEEMRGLPGSWDRGLETFRRLRGIRRSNFQTVIGMTLLGKNADQVDATIDAIRTVIPDFRRTELHLNIGHESGHYFDNVGRSAVSPDHARVIRAINDHRAKNGKWLHPVHFLENRYQALVPAYYETGRSPLPCSALSTSCFVDAYWNLYACSIWEAKSATCGSRASISAHCGIRPRGSSTARTCRRELSALLDALRGVPDAARQPRPCRRRTNRRHRRAGVGRISGLRSGARPAPAAPDLPYRLLSP